MPRVMKIVILASAPMWTLYASSVAAQSNDRLVERLEACASEQDDAARLNCYDTTVADARRIAEQDRERARVRTVEDFGLSETQISRQEDKIAEVDPARAEQLRGERASSDPDRIAATVVEIFSDRRSGKRLFILDNGQIWQETTISRMKRNPRESQKITISRESLGSFRLRVEGKQGFVSVKRLK